MHGILKKSGYIISEKVVRRLMKEENLIVYKAREKKYSSYKGEISLEGGCRHKVRPNLKLGAYVVYR